MTTIYPQEIKKIFKTFEEANTFWNIQMESLHGYKLRGARLEYEENYDTKIGLWKVYIRWFPLISEQVVHAEA